MLYALLINLMSITKAVTSLLLMFVSLAIATAQSNATPSKPRPTPRFTGKLVKTDGARQLTLVASKSSQSFSGSINSTCMVPSKSAKREPLDLSSIPIGTPMTVFYVRHAEKGKPSSLAQNVILAIRLNRVGSRSSRLPEGVAIPCFKPMNNAGN
jgi:hypothetical protein